MKKPVMLLIMDGFGIAPDSKGNAISHANIQNLKTLFEKYPYSKLNASEHFVGLPDGQMGNSEVGHTNMGAGRVVWQSLSNITRRIEDGSFFDNVELNKAMDNVLAKGSVLHLLGLLSDGGVHSHNTHLYALLEMAKKKGLKDVYVHCIMDGRDVLPTSGMQFIDELEEKIKEIGVGKIATVSGRFYAMDRDKRWDRVEKAYLAYTNGEGRSANTARELLQYAYDNGETDEFVVPGIVDGIKAVSDGDSIIFFNFRPDRAREITRAFVDKNFEGFERKTIVRDLTYICMTQYDAEIENVSIAYPPQDLNNTLGEYIASKGLKQLRIAETEKYAHVTFFFNGGVETQFEGEERILIPSPKVATYDLKPSMSAVEVTDACIEKIREGNLDLIIMNLANCDMVGHTGVFDAVIEAVETVDKCVGRIVEEILKVDGKLLITADHGNADEMLDEDGNVQTAHSKNQVPLIYVANDVDGIKLKDGSLCDIAPTLLKMMNLSVPSEMEGKELI